MIVLYRRREIWYRGKRYDRRAVEGIREVDGEHGKNDDRHLDEVGVK